MSTNPCSTNISILHTRIDQLSNAIERIKAAFNPVENLTFFGFQEIWLNALLPIDLEYNLYEVKPIQQCMEAVSLYTASHSQEKLAEINFVLEEIKGQVAEVEGDDCIERDLFIRCCSLAQQNFGPLHSINLVVENLLECLLIDEPTLSNISFRLIQPYALMLKSALEYELENVRLNLMRAQSAEGQPQEYRVQAPSQQPSQPILPAFGRGTVRERMSARENEDHQLALLMAEGAFSTLERSEASRTVRAPVGSTLEGEETSTAVVTMPAQVWPTTAPYVSDQHYNQDSDPEDAELEEAIWRSYHP